MFFVMQNIWSYSIFINFNAPNVFFQKWKFSLFGQSTCYELNIFCPIWLKFCVWPPFVFTFAMQEWFHSRKNIWPDFLFFFSYGQKFEKIVVMLFLKDIYVIGCTWNSPKGIWFLTPKSGVWANYMMCAGNLGSFDWKKGPGWAKKLVKTGQNTVLRFFLITD